MYSGKKTGTIKIENKHDSSQNVNISLSLTFKKAPNSVKSFFIRETRWGYYFSDSLITLEIEHDTGASPVYHLTGTQNDGTTVDVTGQDYSSGVMMPAGSYTMEVTIPGNDIYESCSAITNFTLKRAGAKLVIGEVIPGDSVDYTYYWENIWYADSSDPWTAANSEVELYYGKKGEVLEDLDESDDLTVLGYTKTVPTEPGDYVAMAQPKSSGNLSNAYAYFSITAVEGKGTISIEDTKYGEKIEPVIKTSDYDVKTVEVYYKESGAADSKYTKDVPYLPGKYDIKAVFPKNDIYIVHVATCEFKILENEGKVTFEIPDLKYGEKIKKRIKSDDYDADKAVIYYKLEKDSDEKYSKTEPEVPGKYVAYVQFERNDKFTAHKEFCKFTIMKADGDGTVTSKDCYAGVKPEVSYASVKNGIENVKIEYKLATAPDSTYTTEVPEKVGKYIVRATFPENEYFLAANATANITISYLPNPGFEPLGKMGRNEFYTTDVMITPPAGYLVSTTYGSGYVSQLKYSEVSQYPSLYFKEIKTGALTDKVEMPKYKVDSVLPQFTEKIKDNDVFFENEKTLTIKDINLSVVKVNGQEVKVNNGSASILLDSNGGRETYTITAIDMAGNEIEYTITVKAEWLELGILPENTLCKLEKGEKYKLGEGKWTVTNDDTVYAGGMDFYVADDSQLTFTKQ